MRPDGRPDPFPRRHQGHQAHHHRPRRRPEHGWPYFSCFDLDDYVFHALRARGQRVPFQEHPRRRGSSRPSASSPASDHPPRPRQPRPPPGPRFGPDRPERGTRARPRPRSWAALSAREREFLAGGSRARWKSAEESANTCTSARLFPKLAHLARLPDDELGARRPRPGPARDDRLRNQARPPQLSRRPTSATSTSDPLIASRVFTAPGFDHESRKNNVSRLVFSNGTVSLKHSPGKGTSPSTRRPACSPSTSTRLQAHRRHRRVRRDHRQRNLQAEHPCDRARLRGKCSNAAPPAAWQQSSARRAGDPVTASPPLGTRLPAGETAAGSGGGTGRASKTDAGQSEPALRSDDGVPCWCQRSMCACATSLRPLSLGAEEMHQLSSLAKACGSDLIRRVSAPSDVGQPHTRPGPPEPRQPRPALAGGTCLACSEDGQRVDEGAGGPADRRGREGEQEGPCSAASAVPGEGIEVGEGEPGECP